MFGNVERNGSPCETRALSSPHTLFTPIRNFPLSLVRNPAGIWYNFRMKVVLLAGGAGARIAEECVKRPKPMAEVCGKSILCHIMKVFSLWKVW